jgi:4-amino-4-deoxy-L-arabinose transferase-like glycosyltransferase
MIPPLYSAALWLVYSLFGRGYWQVGLFNTLLDAASIVMLYHIARRLMPRGEWVGVLAGVMYALYPYLVFQNLTVIDTPLFIFFLHAFVLLMILLRERPALDKRTWLIAALGGVVLGFSLLARPVLPFVAMSVAFWFLFRLSIKQTVLRLLPVALVGALVLLPWIIRNYGVFDGFVPLTTTSGSNFWQGNSPYVIPYLRAGYDVQWTSPDPPSEDLNPREADARRFALALQFLRENPQLIPELVWVKFLTHWSIDITPRLNPGEGDAPRPDYQGDAQIGTDAGGNLTLDVPPGDPVALYNSGTFGIAREIHRWYFGALLLLALVGIALTVRQWREVSLLWFVQISMTITYIVFHPSTRYRVPSDPLLFLFSAYTLVWLWERVTRSRRPHRAEMNPLHP